MVAKRTPAGKAWAASGNLGPLAVTLDQAAELLGVGRRYVQRAARQIKPYRHHDGSDRWPLRELARVLADTGRVVPPELVASPVRAAQDRKRRHRQRDRAS